MRLNISERRCITGFLLLILCGVHGNLQACEPAPGNEYEKVFCQLKRSGKGEALPSIHEFRKNPPLTQALLLKKPAERAGIPLKIPERGNAEVVDRQLEVLLSAPSSAAEKKILNKEVVSKQAVSKKVEPKPVTPKVKTPDVTPVVVREAVSVLDTCVVNQFELHCSGAQYRLVTNQTNQQLREGVLSEGHRLNLPAFQGSAQDLEDYLLKAYRRYVEGMLEIGLGASTMSYTKFVRVYEFNAAQGLSFAERFETAYQFQKREKASIGVNTKPMLAAGFNTRFCSELTGELLACEHQRDNYLFLKSKVP